MKNKFYSSYGVYPQKQIYGCAVEFCVYVCSFCFSAANPNLFLSVD